MLTSLLANKVHHVIAMPLFISLMLSDSRGEAGVRSIFLETFSGIAEGRLAIDEVVTESVPSPNPSGAPDSNVAKREGEGCVRPGLELLSGEAGVGNHVDWATGYSSEEEEERSFVDIVG